MNPGNELPTYEYHFDINRATTASLKFPGENGEITRIPFQRFPLSIEALRMNPEINLGDEMPVVIEAQGWFAEGRVTVIGDEVRFVANRHFALKKDKDTPDDKFKHEVLQLIKGEADYTIYFVPVMPNGDEPGPIDTYRFFNEHPDAYVLYEELPKNPLYLIYLESLRNRRVKTNVKPS